MNYYSSDALARPSGSTLDIAAIMRQVYSWMFLGLLTTAGVAYFIGTQQSLVYRIFSNPILLIVLVIAQIGVALFLQARIMSLSPGTAITLFLVYSGLMGVTMSSIFILYTNVSIATAFVTTAATFGIVSLFAYTTKMDLSRMGSILLVALIGLIIATIVNIFVNSTPLFWIINYAGVLIFVGLTAYDTQKIKNMAANVGAMTGSSIATQADGTLVQGATAESALIQRVAIVGALHLYLDFVNLFWFILRITGSGSRR